MSEIESSFLNEYQNQDEMMQELYLDSHIYFDPSVLFGNLNDSSTVLNKKVIQNLKQESHLISKKI